MGIRTLPVTDTNNNCPNCFAANSTPIHVWLTFSGIDRGALWAPVPHDPPPNGIFKLTNIADCLWLYEDENKTINWEPHHAGGSSLIAAFKDPAINAFKKQFAGNCTHFFNNGLVAPAGNFYYGGQGQILYVTASTIYSFSTTMALLNIVPATDMFAEPNVMPGETVMHRFASHREVTNIKIKQEY